MRKKKQINVSTDSLLERRLIEFSQEKSKEKYVRFLEALRNTDVLVPSARAENELPFGNEGILKTRQFRPDVIYVKSLNKRLMPIFSNQSKISADYVSGKSVFMHSSDWIKAFRLIRCDGVILNPFSEISFFLSADQIRILSLFQPNASEYR